MSAENCMDDIKGAGFKHVDVVLYAPESTLFFFSVLFHTATRSHCFDHYTIIFFSSSFIF